MTQDYNHLDLSNIIDLQEQTDLFQAMFETFMEKTGWKVFLVMLTKALRIMPSRGIVTTLISASLRKMSSASLWSCAFAHTHARDSARS